MFSKYIPISDAAEGDHGHHAHLLKNPWETIQQWWRLTTGQKWLNSRLSRRDLVWVLIILESVVFLPFDTMVFIFSLIHKSDDPESFYTAASTVSADVVFTCGGLIVLKLFAQHDLKRDAALSLIATTSLLIASSDPCSWQGMAIALLCGYMACGIHSVIIGMNAVGLVGLHVSGCIQMTIDTMLLLLLYTVVAGHVEYRCASIAIQLEWADEVLQSCSREPGASASDPIDTANFHGRSDLMITPQQLSGVTPVWETRQQMQERDNPMNVLEAYPPQLFEASEGQLIDIGLHKRDCQGGNANTVNRRVQVTKGKCSSKSVSSLAFSLSSSEAMIKNNAEHLPLTANTVDTALEKRDVQTQTLGLDLLPPKLPARVKPRVILGRGKRMRRHLRETPSTTIRMLIAHLLHQCNLRGKGCCNMHLALHALRQHVHELSLEGCRPQFMPHSAGQCNSCYVLQSDDHDGYFSGMCTLCLQFNTEGSNSGGRSDSHASSNDVARESSLTKPQLTSL